MRCWVSKYGKKGAWSSFYSEFLENIQKLRFCFKIYKYIYMSMYINRWANGMYI